MRMKFTNSARIKGLMAVRSMSQKAQRGYNETDPMAVYQTEEGLWIENCDGLRGPMPLEEAENWLAYFGSIVQNDWCMDIDYDTAVEMMDDELREELHRELAPCDHQTFFDAYAEAHKERFGEEWIMNTNNPVV